MTSSARESLLAAGGLGLLIVPARLAPATAAAAGGAGHALAMVSGGCAPSLVAAPCDDGSGDDGGDNGATEG